MPTITFKSCSLVHGGTFTGSMYLRYPDEDGVRQGIVVTQQSLELALSLHPGKARIPVSGPDQAHCNRLEHEADPKASRVRRTGTVDRKDVEKVILLRQVSQMRQMLESFDSPAVSFQIAKDSMSNMIETIQKISVGAAEIAAKTIEEFA